MSPRLQPEVDVPPVGLLPALEALWWDARGDWDRAHEAVAEGETRDAAWVHANLHRKEGDVGNAAYWYRRAGRPVCVTTLAAESNAIAESLMAGA